MNNYTYYPPGDFASTKPNSSAEQDVHVYVKGVQAQASVAKNTKISEDEADELLASEMAALVERPRAGERESQSVLQPRPKPHQGRSIAAEEDSLVDELFELSMRPGGGSPAAAAVTVSTAPLDEQADDEAMASDLLKLAGSEQEVSDENS